MSCTQLNIQIKQTASSPHFCLNPFKNVLIIRGPDKISHFLNTKMKSEVISNHRDYPSRWGVLGTVFFLNIANNALWISYSSVASTSAEYYEKSVSDVDWLGSIGFIVGKV